MAWNCNPPAKYDGDYPARASWRAGYSDRWHGYPSQPGDGPLGAYMAGRAAADRDKGAGEVAGAYRDFPA